MGGGIVGFERSTAAGWLFVAHFFKGGDDWNGFLSVEKKTTGFGFGCRRGNASNSLADDVDCTAWLGLRRIGGRGVTEDIDACTTTASIGVCEIGGVSNDAENHVTGAETSGRIGMGG